MSALQHQMANSITIRMGGYGPPTTGFSRALKRIGWLETFAVLALATAVRSMACNSESESAARD